MRPRVLPDAELQGMETSLFCADTVVDGRLPKFDAVQSAVHHEQKRLLSIEAYLARMQQATLASAWNSWRDCCLSQKDW